VNFADGWAYSKGKMEEIMRSGVLELDVKHTKKEGPIAGLKKEDVDVIMKEFEIPRVHAEKALQKNGGDLEKTLVALVSA